MRGVLHRRAPRSLHRFAASCVHAAIAVRRMRHDRLKRAWRLSVWRAGGDPQTLWIDVRTGRPLRIEYLDGDGATSVDISDWRKVAGRNSVSCRHQRRDATTSTSSSKPRACASAYRLTGGVCTAARTGSAGRTRAVGSAAGAWRTRRLTRDDRRAGVHLPRRHRCPERSAGFARRQAARVGADRRLRGTRGGARRWAASDAAGPAPDRRGRAARLGRIDAGPRNDAGDRAGRRDPRCAVLCRRAGRARSARPHLALRCARRICAGRRTHRARRRREVPSDGAGRRAVNAPSSPTPETAARCCCTARSWSGIRTRRAPVQVRATSAWAAAIVVPYGADLLTLGVSVRPPTVEVARDRGRFADRIDAGNRAWGLRDISSPDLATPRCICNRQHRRSHLVTGAVTVRP